MAIGAIDKTTTKELTKTLQRKEKRSQHKAEPSTSGAATLASFSESDLHQQQMITLILKIKQTKIHVELIF